MHSSRPLIGALVALALGTAAATGAPPRPLGFPDAEQVGAFQDSVVLPPIQYKGKSAVGTTIRYIVVVYRTASNTIEYAIDVDATVCTGDTWVLEEAVPISTVLDLMAAQTLSHGGDGVTQSCNGVWNGSFIDGSEAVCRWVGGMWKRRGVDEADRIDLR